MRVLVAGRNAKVLAKAAGAFAHDLEIHTAGTKAACFALLLQVDFDLIVACETLGDGSGLEVLSHAAVNTPNTLRIFAARPATLNLLRGELGLFGLFRTLPYPINFQKLWAAINLARSTCAEETAKPAAPPAPPVPDVVFEETWDASDVDVVAVARKHPASRQAGVAARATQSPARARTQRVGAQEPFTDIRVIATSARGRSQQPVSPSVPTTTTANGALRRSASSKQAVAVNATRVTATRVTATRVTATTPASPSASARLAPPVTATRVAATTAGRARTPSGAARPQSQPRQQEITSGMRAAARYAAAHGGLDTSAIPTRIPESDAFKRARARRATGRVEPIFNTESLSQLAKAALTKRPPPQYWPVPNGKKRAAWFVGSGVFAATTAAVLTFFMVNANNSIKQPKLPTMASITQPVSNRVFPWQPETQQPMRQAAFMRSEAPASTVADIQAEAEAASESADGDPDHPGPPPPYSPPPPSEPPSLETPAIPVDE